MVSADLFFSLKKQEQPFPGWYSSQSIQATFWEFANCFIPPPGAYSKSWGLGFTGFILFCLAKTHLRMASSNIKRKKETLLVGKHSNCIHCYTGSIPKHGVMCENTEHQYLYYCTMQSHIKIDAEVSLSGRQPLISATDLWIQPDPMEG